MPDTQDFQSVGIGGGQHLPWQKGAWFFRIFENAAMGIAITDLDGKFRMCNPAYCEIVGYSKEELGRLRFSDLIHEDDRQANLRRNKDLIQGRIASFEIENRYLHKLCHPVWVHKHVSVLPDERGRPAFMIALVTDISERVRAAERRAEHARELARVRERLELFIAHAPVALAMFDRDMRYVSFSQRWLSDYGLEGRELRGLSHFEVFPDIPATWRSALRRGLAGEVIRESEDRFERSDGRVQWLRWEIQPWYEPDGEVAGIILFTEDITARKQAELSLRESEARLRLAAEAAHFGTFDVDFASDTAQWSPDALAILGLPPDSGATSLSDLAELVDPSAAAEIRAMIRNATGSQGGGVLTHTILLHSETGGDRWIQVHGRVRSSGKGEGRRPTSVRGMLLDVTDSRRLQDSLSHSRRLETVGRLAGGIAHDFNNLLTVIVSNMELARRLTEDAETQALIDSAIEAAELGSSFNKRLLSLASHRRQSTRVMRVNRHLPSIWRLLSRSVGESVELRMEHSRSLWPVRIDPSELDGALLNLAINARDAMPHGGALCIHARNTTLGADDVAALDGAREGDFVRIDATDTGTGMPQDVAEKALEPFYTTKPPSRGRGLGLTSVATFAARSGGFVAIDSAEGRGTTVSLFLPRDTDSTPDRDTAPDDNEIPGGDGELVLVVEDDDMVREAELRRLEVLGYAVLEARNADEARKILDAGEPVDLVISDIVMPGETNGIELAAYVRRNYPALGVLLTSGHASGKEGRGSDERPADTGFLAKPFTLAALAREVRAALKAAG